MVKAADILRLVMENSKARAHAPGELKTPSYANLKTPDNHKRGSREVDGKKGLGDRPGSKKITQTGKPKSKAYDVGGPAAPVKMKEARTAGAKRRYGQGNNENQAENAVDPADDPRGVQESGGVASKENTAMFGAMAKELGFGRKPSSKGAIDPNKRFRVHVGGTRYKYFPTLEAASQFCRKVFDAKGIVLSIEDRAQKAEDARKQKQAMTVEAGGNTPPPSPKTGERRPGEKVKESSKTSKTAPGEMRKPPVKTDTPAKSASVRSGDASPSKKVPARDKKPALNKDAAEFVRVSVKKVEEGVKELAAMGITFKAK